MAFMRTSVMVYACAKQASPAPVCLPTIEMIWDQIFPYWMLSLAAVRAENTHGRIRFRNRASEPSKEIQSCRGLACAESFVR
jgi:hypothetical protein